MRKQLLLRIDPTVHDALARWCADEFRSLNAHIEMPLRRVLDDAGRMPGTQGPYPSAAAPNAEPLKWERCHAPRLAHDR